MKEILIKSEFIKLDQLLKFADLVDSGGLAKLFIKDGKVKVNGEVCTQRGRKIYENYIVELEETKVIVKK